MKKTNLYSLIFVVALFVNNSLFAQLSSNEIDAITIKALEKLKVAGAAIAVVKDGKIIHGKGYGVKSILTKQPVDEHTNFQIASNSKAFTTAALSILVDEGKISWKDKVKKYIPEFTMYDKYVADNFLIEDLLCHRSGLGLGAGDLMFFPNETDFTIKDVLSSFQYLKPTSAFRTQFDYDNLLYFVAGELIQRVSGMSWEQFVQSRIMKPLEMNNSYPSLKDVKDRTNLAMPHSTIGIENGKMRTFELFNEMINGAAGGILSNVDDMSKWMILQLNKGKYGEKLDKQLFSQERQNEMWKIHTVMDVYPNPRYNPHFAGYGLGWFLKDSKGYLNVYHSGGLPGMLSYVRLVPELNLGVVILTNTENGGGDLMDAVYASIIDSYLGLDKIDYVDKFSREAEAYLKVSDSVTTNVWKKVEVAKKTKVNQQNYVGTYKDNWFGKIEIFVKNNQMWFKSLRSPKLNGPMSFYEANTFAIKWEYQDMNCDALATFTVDEKGKAKSIKMKGISPNMDFSFDFQDLDLQRVE